MPTLIVKGMVVTTDGEPLDRKVVEVRPRLSATSSGSPSSTLTTEGAYTATYTTTGSEVAFDVEIVVSETDETEIGRSVLLYAVSGEITVDIVIGEDKYRGRSDYRRIEAKIGSLRGSLPVHELGGEHIEYLAAKLNMNPLRIAHYIHAHRMNVLLEGDVPAWAFYALLRHGLPSNLGQLLAEGRVAHERAIAAGIATNIISDPGEGPVDDALGQLQAHTAASAVWQHPTNPSLKSKFRRLLDTASGAEADPATQLVFMKKHLAHTGTIDEFWEDVNSDVDLGPTVVATYQWTIQISALANDHMPLIEALQAKREDVGDPINAFRDLASLDVDDWIDFLSEAPAIGAPPSIPEDWPEVDRIQRYAETIERIIADTYPTTVIHKRIERDHTENPGSIAGAADLIQFFDDNPDFELHEHDLAVYLADNTNALDNVADEAATTTNLKKLRRLSHLAPRGLAYKVVKPLYQAGIHSALQISKMSRANFLRKFTDSFGGAEIAGSVYQKAAHSSSISLAIATRFASGFNSIANPLVPSKMASFGAQAELETIFGNLDFCACEHCRSVFSPAAYYVDLLHFLENQPGKDAQSDALDALKERRPELIAIELSCINSNTEVPYIDLVNEILEYQVLCHVVANPPLPILNKASWQTAWTAEELAIRPEHQLSYAYNATAGAVYPWLLPFNLPFAETTLYHQSFDVPRERMLNAYPNGDAHDDRRARARLGLDAKTWRIIAGESLTEAPRDFWKTTEADWHESLRTVSTFLKRAEISLGELATLLRTRFIGRAELELTYAAPPDDCNLDLATMPDLDATDLDKFHRFIRLQRKLGWTAEEVDLALHALGGATPTLDAVMVRKLAVVHRLKERLGLAVDVLLTLWSTITTHTPADDETKPSFYAARFINRLLEEPGTSLFALNGGFTDLAVLTDRFSTTARIATVQAALGVSGEQAVYLDEWIGGPDPDTTLAKLSMAHRRASLARAMGVSLIELRRLIDLVGSSPFREDGAAPTEADLAGTESFLDAVDGIRSSAFTSEQIAYLLKHTTPATPGVAPIPEVRTPFLRDLAEGLAEIASKYTIETGGLGEGPLGDRLRAALMEILDPGEVEAAMALLNLTSTEDGPGQEARIEAQFASGSGEPLIIFTDLGEAKDNLVPPLPDLGERAERYKYVLSKLYSAMRKRSSRELVVQRLAQHFGLAADSMQALLSLYLTTPASLLDFFADDPLLTGEMPNDAARYAYERVHKSARLISLFEFDVTDLHYLYGQGVTGWADLDALPSGEGQIVPLEFAGWKRLFDYTRARALFPHHPTTLSDLRAANNTIEVFDLLAVRLGWDRADISHAHVSVHDFGLSDYDDEAALLALAETVMVARQLYTPVRDVHAWCIAEPQTDQAAAMRKALRGRYDESTWRGAARSIQDVLRIEQRDALVAYLILRGIDHGESPIPVTSADELYAYLLIDVEMSVCMTTSRIRFALSAVQQFIQRVFLALEEDLTFDVDAESEWQWMKHYRLWEANRKVFLYPENWIDPALRDDKSSFFRDLEETLLQGDLTKSLAEAAYVAYLEKLQSVAIPEVMGMYHEYEYDKAAKQVRVNDLHVVARTGHGPYRHVYRQRQDLRRWTAWEELPGDIQGEHIMPMVYGDRLYVFWVEFELEDVQPDSLGSPDFPTKQPVARLFWVEKHDGAWTSRFHAEGCKLSIGNAAPNEKIEWVRTNRSCTAFENPYTQSLEIHVYAHNRKMDSPNNQAFISVTSFGRFILSPRIGRFVASHMMEQSEIVIQTPRKRAGQRWMASDTGKSADFRLPKTGGLAELFAKVTPIFWTLFRHDTLGEDLSEAGFFVSAARHQFYVVPKTTKQGPQGPQVRSMDKPAPNAMELLPWSAYAFLSADAEPLMGGEPLDPSQGLFAADALQVPQKWKGGIPGSPGKPVTDSILSGQAAGMIKELTDKSNKILDTPPALEMGQTIGLWYEKIFRIFVFQHTYVGMLLGQIRRHGVEGLLRPLAGSEGDELSRQQISEVAVPQIGDYDEDEHDYRPGKDLTFPSLSAPISDGMDFSYGGPLSVYNWEMFFHAPLLVSDILSRQGRYEEADSWLRGIFDPTATDIGHSNRFWRLKPFFATSQVPSINDLLLLLQGDDPEDTAKLEFEYQVEEWRDNPFNPHLIARLRSGAYQWATVMRYLDNLIAWGDARFAEDTVESVNEATQIYMLARNILGDRPVEVKKTVAPAVKTYDDIDQDLDSFSNALVELETKGKGPPGFLQLDIVASWPGDWHTKNPAPRYWYFCVPANPKLLAYWDVVEDRLFKIRHCQDIHGVERRLALFDPPIDPGQIIKALAGGGDLASALSQLAGRAPLYRFQTYLSKAYELAGEVKALGSGLLQAYEKRDAEELSLLRNAHERSVLALARAVKEAQVEEAGQGVRAAESARPIAQARRDYYQGLVDAGWIASEQAQVDLQKYAMDATLAAGLANMLGSELGMIPNFDGGVEGMSSPVVKAAFGGAQLAAVANMFAGILQTESSYSSMASGLAGTTAGYERRLQDWKQQVVSADLELKQIEQQIEAARARKVVSEKELKSHDLQIQNSAVEDAFMRSKYTNAELYGWMIAKVSSLYKQAYQLAYRAAVAAEKAYQYELHSDESFIGFGYWDQSRSGLLAGEILSLDLRRLDAAYLDNNIREYELTKRISLAQLDPYALAQLRETGSCYMNVPEFVFDLDHPGHYLRRIKMVSAALPGVTGPHVNVGCTLTLESSKIRVSPLLAPEPVGYGEDEADERFTYRVGKVEQIATSSGQDSTGMFESSFNDPRYLPFEGAGAIGTWRIDLPGDKRQFDYRTIADVVVTIQYTAREGGGQLRNAALGAAHLIAANTYQNIATEYGSALLLRAATDFSPAWHTFLYAETATSVREFNIDLVAERFPHLAARWPDLTIKAVRLILVTDNPQEVPGAALERDGEVLDHALVLMTTPNTLGNLPTTRWSGMKDPGPWKVKVNMEAANFPVVYRESYEIGASTYYRFKDGVIRDMLLIVHYELTPAAFPVYQRGMRTPSPISLFALSVVLFASACQDGSSEVSTTEAITVTGPGSAGTSATDGQAPSTATNSGTDTGGPGSHAICESYLACIAAVAPGELPMAQGGFGGDGTCWQGNEADAQLCLDACLTGLEMFNALFPEEPKCSLCQDHAECDMAAGELCHLGKCEITTCGDGIVDDEDICDSQPDCDPDCQGPLLCNPISGFRCGQDEVCLTLIDDHVFLIKVNCYTPQDTLPEGSPCTQNGECGTGMTCTCTKNYPSCVDQGGARTCTKYCDLGDPNLCAAGSTCVPYVPLSGYPLAPELGFLGVCIPG